MKTLHCFQLSKNTVFLLDKVYMRGCSSDIASSYYFRPSKVVEHVTSRISRWEFKTK